MCTKKNKDWKEVAELVGDISECKQLVSHATRSDKMITLPIDPSYCNLCPAFTHTYNPSPKLHFSIYSCPESTD